MNVFCKGNAAAFCVMIGILHNFMCSRRRLSRGTTFNMLIYVYTLLITACLSMGTTQKSPTRNTQALSTDEGKVQMHMLLDDTLYRSTLIREGSVGKVRFSCTDQIESCKNPSGQDIPITESGMVDDRSDVQAIRTSEGIEMRIRFEEDLPFGNYSCQCRSKTLNYEYLYRLCTMQEPFDYDEYFQGQRNYTCFATINPNDKSKRTITTKITEEICDKTHAMPMSLEGENNVTLCDNFRSRTLCHSFANDPLSGTKRREGNVIVRDPQLCGQKFAGFAAYSILYVAFMVYTPTTCEELRATEKHGKHALEKISFENPAIISTGYAKFCFVAPNTTRDIHWKVALTKQPSLVKPLKPVEWITLIHTGPGKLIDIEFNRPITELVDMDTLIVTCRHTIHDTIEFAYAAVRLVFQNFSIFPTIKPTTGEATCGTVRNLNCHIQVPPSVKLHFTFTWFLNKTTNKIEVTSNTRHGEDDHHLHKGPGDYMCRIEAYIVQTECFTLRATTLMRLPSIKYPVPYACMSRQVHEQIKQDQLRVADAKRNEFILHLALALGAIVICGALAGICILLATKTNLFSKLLGTKTKRSRTTETETFDKPGLSEIAQPQKKVDKINLRKGKGQHPQKNKSTSLLKDQSGARF